MKRIASAAAVALLCAALVAILYLAPEDDRPAAQAEAAATTTDSVLVGGVRRPATDVQPVDKPPPEDTSPKLDIGNVEPIPADGSVHIQSVMEAVQQKKYPERLSVLHQPKPFQLDQYLLNPDAYLNIVEPGRVFQSAQPGVGVPVLQALSRSPSVINQGESVTLSVKTLPNMPATFTSFNLGAFENKLITITVKADAEGVAKTSFTGTRGTFNDVNILVASPVATEQVHYVVHVIPPTAAQ